jgi:hypothetical protein
MKIQITGKLYFVEPIIENNDVDLDKLRKYLINTKIAVLRDSGVNERNGEKPTMPRYIQHIEKIIEIYRCSPSSDLEQKQNVSISIWTKDANQTRFANRVNLNQLRRFLAGKSLNILGTSIGNSVEVRLMT